MQTDVLLLVTVEVFLHGLVFHVGVILVIDHGLDTIVVMLVELVLSEEFLFLLGDTVKFGAYLVESSLEGRVVDGHGLDAVSVELSSGTWAGEDLSSDGVWAS